MSINIKKKALNVKNGDTYDNFDMFFLGDVGEAVDDWFDEHPEAVTNVEDNSITAAKLAPAVREAVEGVDDLEDDVTDLKSAIGNKSSLNTDTKTNLVSAINEVNGHFLDGIDTAVDNWLDDHPEATTTVQDHSLTHDKLVLKTLNFVTPEMFGAKGDGLTDDTLAIKAAVDSGGAVIFSNKTYLVSVNSAHDACIPLPSNTVIYMFGTKIALSGTSVSAYQIIDITDAQNVYVLGKGEIIGDRADHDGSSGEWGMGINIYNSSNVTVQNITVKNAWGDGIYLNSSSNVNIDNCKLINNRRNNISIISCDKCFLENCIFDSPNGTSPSSNISIEANTTDDQIKDLVVRDCICENTGGTYAAYITTRSNNNSIKFIGCKFDKPFTTTVLSGDYNTFDIIDTEIVSDDLLFGAINVGNTPPNTYITYDNVCFIGGTTLIKHTGDALHNLNIINSVVKEATFVRTSAWLGNTDAEHISNNNIEIMVNPNNVVFSDYVASVYPNNTPNTISVKNTIPYEVTDVKPPCCFFGLNVFSPDEDAERAFNLTSIGSIPMGQIYRIINTGEVRFTIGSSPYVYDVDTKQSGQLIIVPSGHYCDIWNVNQELYCKIV